MTDSEIIKALECCINCDCKNCPCKVDESHCDEIPTEEILDLINRLKAELDESREKNAGLALALLHEVVNEDEQLRNEITKVAKSEARKEFVERLKEEAVKTYYGELVFTEDDIDNLLKEMG